jgi:predicted nucleotidyltransferase
VLYGSYARRRARSESHLDIAMLGCPQEKFWECHRSLLAMFADYALDMVRLEEADSLFRDEIMHEGFLLWGGPEPLS